MSEYEEEACKAWPAEWGEFEVFTHAPVGVESHNGRWKLVRAWHRAWFAQHTSADGVDIDHDSYFATAAEAVAALKAVMADLPEGRIARALEILEREFVTPELTKQAAAILRGEA
jgi:hypothetical protein